MDFNWQIAWRRRMTYQSRYCVKIPTIRKIGSKRLRNILICISAKKQNEEKQFQVQKLFLTTTFNHHFDLFPLLSPISLSLSFIDVLLLDPDPRRETVMAQRVAARGTIQVDSILPKRRSSSDPPAPGPTLFFFLEYKS
jgi:hypothetical protein